jgi:hypothetical protein
MRLVAIPGLILLTVPKGWLAMRGRVSSASLTVMGFNVETMAAADHVESARHLTNVAKATALHAKLIVRGGAAVTMGQGGLAESAQKLMPAQWVNVMWQKRLTARST